VGSRRFVIINTETNDTVKNSYRREVNNEHCEIMFGPAQAGKYYFYSLPFEKQGGWGGYVRDYLPQETAPADVMDQSKLHSCEKSWGVCACNMP
jgi:hypothetical protein